ncbi:uncharacterized protein LOC141649084 [Silene latifolia]|uniref:uncharacterized protein LOC141649084 n=1 Tax=Silene latifolia TaxID=37657 RepID=UPI003D7722F4
MGYERVREWVEDVIREIERDDAERFITGVWALWERRNQVVFENEVLRVVRRVSELLREMVEVQIGEEKGGLGHSVKDTGVRDDKGEVLWGWEERRQAEFEVRIAEAEAILHGLRIARRMKHRYICMEGDCMEVIEALQSRKEGRTDFHLVNKEILLLANSFCSVSWSRM